MALGGSRSAYTAGGLSSYRNPSGRTEEMDAGIGDRVEVQPKSVHAAARSGTVESVVAGARPRYRVRWDDGRVSIISATDGALSVASRKRRSRSRQTRA